MAQTRAVTLDDFNKSHSMVDLIVLDCLDLSENLGAFSFVPLSEFVGRPSWTKSG